MSLDSRFETRFVGVVVANSPSEIAGGVRDMVCSVPAHALVGAVRAEVQGDDCYLYLEYLAWPQNERETNVTLLSEDAVLV